ncbi:MAG TPA: lysophospholipid acyltransferase family protein [Dehalococcoidia bacterium]|nr:lysophospholipid acyltransferase family protein [Dehalococcoidia bacterium]
MPRPSKWRYYLMVAVINTIGRFPLRWRYGIARFVADRVYDWGPRIGPNVRSNIRHVLGPAASDEEVDRVARDCARNTGRYYADVVGMHRMDVRRFFDHDLVLEGLEYVTDAQKAGHGVVLASAHYANPEFAVQGLLATGIKVFALVEPLDPPELGRLMRSLRTVHGHRYEPVSFAAIKHAMAWLRDGGVVAILVDRDIQKRGIVLDFCGAPARFPTGAVDLAIRTGAVLLPGWVRREGGFKVRASVGPPLPLIITGDHDRDLRTNTQAVLARFERHLKEDPGQWSVLDRIWPDDLQPAARGLPEHGAPGEEQTVH